MKREYTFNITKDMNMITRETIMVPSEPMSQMGLHFAITMDEICRYMAFLIIVDPEGQLRLQKLLGYGDQNISITADSNTTTIGGVPGLVIPGEWQMLLGIFTEYVDQRLGESTAKIRVVVTNEALQCTEAIGPVCFVDGRHGLTIDEQKYSFNQVVEEKKGWYKGDFHTHTTLSDGKDTVKRAMEKAKQQQMDFYVPTEHNLMHTGWQKTSLLICPGIEITTSLGHFNLFGIKRQPNLLPQLLISTEAAHQEECAIEIMKEAKSLGVVVSINHPFLYRWKWNMANTPLSLIDSLEIINDPTYMYAKEANDKAIQLLDVLWKDGYQITGVGGSDAHNLTEERYENATLPSIIGDPLTYVYCERLSAFNLLEGVVKGHTIVTRFIHVEPSISVNGVSYYPGDEIKEKGILTYQITIEKCAQEPVIFLIRDGKRKEIPCIKENGVYIAKSVINLSEPGDSFEYTFIRMEVRTKEGEFLAYINPVYRGRRVPDLLTFGQAVTAMGDMYDN